MNEDSDAQTMRFELRRDEWPLVVAGLRLEGSPASIAIADRIDAWLVEVDRLRLVFLRAVAALHQEKNR